VNREPHHAHGELRYKPWKVVASGADAAGGAYVSAEIDFAEHPDMLAYFPHAALFRFTYRLQDGRLTLSGEIVNRSSRAMPLALGFHPYFAFAPGEAGSVEVVIPSAAEWPLGADGYTSGLPVSTPLSESLPRGVAVTELPEYPGGSQCFTMEPGEAGCELHYKARGTKLVYDMGSKFPIHVLFTPAWTDAVSLEPYTCIPNAFNEPWPHEQSGARGIDAGASFQFQWSIRIENL
jgi:aldose 1-epimerase